MQEQAAVTSLQEELRTVKVHNQDLLDKVGYKRTIKLLSDQWISWLAEQVSCATVFVLFRT